MKVGYNFEGNQTSDYTYIFLVLQVTQGCAVFPYQMSHK